jgi:hypothetical protein
MDSHSAMNHVLNVAPWRGIIIGLRESNFVDAVICAFDVTHMVKSLKLERSGCTNDVPWFYQMRGMSQVQVHERVSNPLLEVFE